MRNLTSILVIFIAVSFSGVFSPKYTLAQEPAQKSSQTDLNKSDPNKADCPPPVMPVMLPMATDLSALVKAITPPPAPPNHTGHVLYTEAKAPDIGDYDAAFQFHIYRPKREINLGFLGNQYITASVVKEKDLDKVFKQLAKDQMIPFDYPKDGCYARAEEMSRLLEKDGINAVKVFVQGKLEVKTSHSPTGKVDWWYHVAPVVLVEKAGKLVPMVIDPSIFDHPVSTDEWVGIQTKATPNQKPTVYYRDRFTYLPRSEPLDQKPRFLNEDLLDAAQVMDMYRDGDIFLY